MGIDLVSKGTEQIEIATRILRAKPEEAAKFGVDWTTLKEAESFFVDPLFSPHFDAARKLTELISSGQPKEMKSYYSKLLSRFRSVGFTPKGETSWQKAAKDYYGRHEYDDDLPVAQGIAADYMEFLRRAMQDLNAYVGAPYSPLHGRARDLIQRLWSSDRRWDRSLPSDLDIWLADFEKLTRDNTKFADYVQESTLDAMRNLFDAGSLVLLAIEEPKELGFRAEEETWVVDGAWVMLSRHGRFVEFAAPLAGATLMVDTGIDKGSVAWLATFDDVYPKSLRLPSQKRVAEWFYPEQDLLETARIAGDAGVIAYQGEVGIVVSHAEMRAPVFSFSDYQNWYNATDSLSDFNLMMNPKIDNWKEVTKNVTEAYLKLAERGLMSVDPQFYVNRINGEVRLAALGSIFSMKSFPFNFFIDSIVGAMTSKFNLIGERAEIEKLVKAEVLAFLGSARLHAGIELADLPGEGKESLEKASNLSMDTVEVTQGADAGLNKADDEPLGGKGNGSSKKAGAGTNGGKGLSVSASQNPAVLPKAGQTGK